MLVTIIRLNDIISVVVTALLDGTLDIQCVTLLIGNTFLDTGV